MTNSPSNSKMLCQTLLGIAMVSMFSSAFAQPSQYPLLSRSGDQGKPNVMFTLDDSGSMELQNMPDEMAWGVRSDGNVSFGSSVRVGFHPGEAPNWPFNRNRFISTENNSLVAARWRSPGVNTLYYNPEINYIPWVQSDGTPLGDANPNAARINAPYTNSAVVDLVGSFTATTSWCVNGNAGCQWQNLSYSPATYYEFDGSNPWDVNSFTRVRIRDSATFLRGGTRADCALDNPDTVVGGKICSQAEEYQNFANWFEYYRKRMLTSIAGASRAFAQQGNDIRLGWGRINKGSSGIDGQTSNSTIVHGVRDFQGVDRLNYFNWLFTQYGNGGTPLRRAMGDVGKYFQRTDDNGPWSTDPGNGQGADKLSCRKAYHIMMSDGYWNGASASGGANSNVDNQSGPLITGPGVPSYKYEPTAPFMDNNSKTLADVAMYYWNRDLNPSLENRVRQDANNPAFWQNLVQFTVGLGVTGTLDPETDYDDVVNGLVSWPAPGSGPTQIDDMWHAAINSHGKFLSAADPDEFASALAEILRSIGARESAEGGSAVSSVTLETQSAKYIPTFKGSSWSGDVQAKRVDINGAAIAELWRASENMPLPNLRNIWLGAQPSVTFNYANVNGTGLADPSITPAMISYMRGDRTTGEGTLFRARDPKTVLGDMVNSLPTLIGSLNNEQYQFLPEGPTTSAARSSYRAFINWKKGRQRILFVGANDGKLHGFNADTGVEEYAFVPEGVVQKLHMPADHNYDHQFMVDGPLAEVDVYNNGWKNLLLGSLGAGGRSVFALDVTDTSNLGANTAKWEFSHPDLGYVVSPVAAGLTESGDWIAATGNGMDSNNGVANLFILNAISGNLIRKIPVPAGTNNGLGGVRLVKDINNVVVAAYAGDQKGNMWRFDLSGSSSADWKVGFGGAPLFTTATGASQPIVGQPEYIDHPLGGQLVIFGTGRLYSEADITGATGMQRAYGVWDKTAGNETSLIGDQIPVGGPLQQQSFDGASGTAFTSTANPVDYHSQWGWYLDLSLADGQRSIYAPQLIRGFVLFNTIAPGPDSGEACDDSLARGFNVLINALTGGAPTKPLLDTNNDEVIDENDTHRASTYETVADGIDRVMLGTNGKVSLQRAFGQTTVNIQGRGLERLWRVLMNPPV